MSPPAPATTSKHPLQSPTFQNLLHAIPYYSYNTAPPTIITCYTLLTEPYPSITLLDPPAITYDYLTSISTLPFHHPTGPYHEPLP